MCGCIALLRPLEKLNRESFAGALGFVWITRRGQTILRGALSRARGLQCPPTRGMGLGVEATRRSEEGDAHMRFKPVCVAILGFAALATAQTSPAPDLHLRGDRFRPLTYAELNPAQKKLAD